MHKDIASLGGYEGALQYLKINGNTHYKEIASALALGKVQRYEGPPCESSVSPPCANGGLCLPRLESFVCLCSGQFSGKTCEKRNAASLLAVFYEKEHFQLYLSFAGKETPGPIRFDGENYLEFPRKVSKSR